MLMPSDDDAMHWSNMTMMMTMEIHPQIVLPALLSVDLNIFLLNIYCSITYVQYEILLYNFIEFAGTMPLGGYPRYRSLEFIY